MRCLLFAFLSLRWSHAGAVLFAQHRRQNLIIHRNRPYLYVWLCLVGAGWFPQKKIELKESSMDRVLWWVTNRFFTSQSFGFFPFQSHSHALRCRFCGIFFYQYLMSRKFKTCPRSECVLCTWNGCSDGTHVTMCGNKVKHTFLLYSRLMLSSAYSTLHFNGRWRNDVDDNATTAKSSIIIIFCAVDRLSNVFEAYLNRIHERKIDSLSIGSDSRIHKHIHFYSRSVTWGDAKPKWFCGLQIQCWQRKTFAKWIYLIFVNVARHKTEEKKREK